jgi:DNA mismatch repair protein MutL
LINKIRILPEVLANKIAAGEVVERPSSVVKELVENALDAQATRILVDIENGGRSLIRVSDNGTGMSRDDALLALERFATSKIHKDEDLFGIRTLGFRGEALPSIAAVSRMSLVTRQPASDTGVEVQVHGGKIVHVADAGAPPGTMISVARLFYNTPARRKFLKAVTTEMGHIADVTAAMALGRPQVHFTLHHNGRAVKQWPRTGDGALRAADVLGQAAGGDLIPLSGQDGDFKISGYLGPARLARATSRSIYLFVNGRRVRDRVLQHALFDAYSGRLVKGRFPLVVLFLELPYDQVDVNVHPTKHEIRFADQRRVHDGVRDRVAAALADAERQQWAVGRSEPPAAERHQGPNDAVAQEPAPYRSSSKVRPLPETWSGDVPGPIGTAAAEPPPAHDGRAPSESGPGRSAATPSAPAPDQQPLWAHRGFSDLSIIGQFQGTYIICQGPRGLVIIDQHAAHERIVYEELKARSGRIDSQRLLMPETVELGFEEARILETLIPRLDALGLELEPFGGTTFVVKSIPVLLDDRRIGPIIVGLVEKAAEVGLESDPEMVLDTCRMVMACHNAVRANQRLGVEQITRMLEQLDRCHDPDHCPHGRPTWIQWSVKDLEKAFLRKL